jgi:hypothetical protein
MTDLHLFQRYSTRENVVTNNTLLLLLSRLYATSPTLLESVLSALFDDAVSVGVSISQQTASPQSVPDGMLIQEPLRVVLETKVDSKLHMDQLIRHLEAFEDGERNGFLLTLSPTQPDREFVSALKEAVTEHNRRTEGKIQPACITFETLVATVLDVAPETDLSLVAVVEDFATYCSDAGLLPRRDFRLRAVPCGMSIADNMKFGVYYEPVSRSSRTCRYLGLYRAKAIRGIGEIATIVEGDIDGNTLHATSGDPTKEQSERIVSISKLAHSRHGWDLSRGHRFTVVDSFHETDYRKLSKGGMRSTKYFDLGRVLAHEDLPPVEEMAPLLNNHTWL